MPLSHDAKSSLRFSSIAMETASEVRAAVAGAGVGVAVLGVLYIFSFLSRLHFVHVLDKWNLTVMTAAIIGAGVGVLLRAYFSFFRK